MEEPLLGMIKLYPYNFVPRGWMKCDGSLINIQTNQALFSLISNFFGGTYPQTFAVPNMVGTEPVPGTVYCIATEGIYPTRE